MSETKTWAEHVEPALKSAASSRSSKPKGIVGEQRHARFLNATSKLAEPAYTCGRLIEQLAYGRFD